MEKNTVVVFGATGRTGRLIVEELLKRNFQVRAVTRSVSAATFVQKEGLQSVEGDLASVASLERIMQGAQFAISAIGSKKPFSKRENDKVDNRGNQNIAKVAKAQSIQHLVVVSSIGVGNSKYAIGFLLRMLMNPVLRMKEKSEEFISTCGINYTIIRPGGLKDTDPGGGIAFGEGGRISGAVSRRQIAKVCVDALTTASMKNRTFEVVDAATVKDEVQPFLITVE